ERRGDLYRRAEEGHGAWRLRARRHQRDDAAREPQVLARNRHQSGRDRADRTHHPEGARVAPSEPPSRADRAYAELTGTPSLAVTRRRLPVGKLLRELRGARPLTRGAAASSPRDLGPWPASRRLSHAALVPPSTGITVPVTKDASSEARKHARLAISSGRPIRRNGARPTRRSRISASR